MWFVLAFLRFFGILLGVALVLVGIVDASGLIQDSEQPETLLQRLKTDIPLILTGVLLLLPYSKLKRRSYWLCFCSLAFLSLGLIALSAKTIFGYQSGQLHWAAVPTSLVILSVIAGNTFVLWYWRRHPETAA
jgi:Na+-transporting methylmalonyl-CoA/oxaloacetate decarboxylase beta subunit